MKAIVTGAASGIGYATALRLAADSMAREGQAAQLLVADISAPGLQALVEQLRSQGAQVESFVGDLSDPQVSAQVIDAAVTAFGGLDVLVSNAGIIQRGALLDVTVEDFDRAFAINTRATWLLGRAAHPWLAKARGALIATASVSATQPTPPLGAYSASKAALVMLVRQMSVEWGPDGIRCNSISPGSTHTGMTDTRYSDPVQRAAAAQRNPLQMVGSAENQAAVIAFLASPDAAYITGENIVVDGGLQNMLMLASAMGDPWKR